MLGNGQALRELCVSQCTHSWVRAHERVCVGICYQCATICQAEFPTKVISQSESAVDQLCVKCKSVN